jgi:hypothetical protein
LVRSENLEWGKVIVEELLKDEKNYADECIDSLDNQLKLIIRGESPKN